MDPINSNFSNCRVEEMEDSPPQPELVTVESDGSLRRG